LKEKECQRNGSYERNIRTRFGKIKDLGFKVQNQGLIIPSLFSHEKNSTSVSGDFQSETSSNFHQMMVYV